MGSTPSRAQCPASGVSIPRVMPAGFRSRSCGSTRCCRVPHFRTGKVSLEFHVTSCLCRNSFRASKGAEVPGATAKKDGLGSKAEAFTFESSAVRMRVCTISAAMSNLGGLLDVLAQV